MKEDRVEGRVEGTKGELEWGDGVGYDQIV